MMEAGIFAKTFKRESVREVFETVKSFGFKTLQFNMACAGLDPMPDEIPQEIILEIRHNLEAYNLKMAGVSGTFNMIHPDIQNREQGLRRLSVLAKHCKEMGTSLITLCTGTRNEYDQWTAHPENQTKSAWQDLTNSMERAIRIADDYDIMLGVEPEFANVVNTITRAQRLIKEMQNPKLKIIFDVANLFNHPPKGELIKDLIRAGLDKLGEYIVMAHLKDRDQKGGFVAPGKGIIPFKFLLESLKTIGYDGPLIAHGFGEEEVSEMGHYFGELLG